MNEVKIIHLPKIKDSSRNLSFLENSIQIPFDIKRTYWIYYVLQYLNKYGQYLINIIKTENYFQE